MAIRALPPKPKITPVVWVGRRRPKLDQPASKARSGQASWAAVHTPMNMPKIGPGQRQGDAGLDRIVIVVREAIRVWLGLVVGPHDEGGEAAAEEQDDDAVHAERIGAAERGHGHAGDEDAEEG